MTHCEYWRRDLSQALWNCGKEFEAVGNAVRQDIFLALLEGRLVRLRRVGTRNYCLPSVTRPSGPS